MFSSFCQIRTSDVFKLERWACEGMRSEQGEGKDYDFFWLIDFLLNYSRAAHKVHPPQARIPTNRTRIAMPWGCLRCSITSKYFFVFIVLLFSHHLMNTHLIVNHRFNSRRIFTLKILCEGGDSSEITQLHRIEC